MVYPKKAKHDKVAQMVAGEIATAEIAADAITNAKLADNAVEQANIGDDAIGAAELKVVTRLIEVANEASVGSGTVAADAGGVILGHYPVLGVESAVVAVSLTAGTGQISVSLLSAQAGGAATVAVVVLQA